MRERCRELFVGVRERGSSAGDKLRSVRKGGICVGRNTSASSGELPQTHKNGRIGSSSLKMEGKEHVVFFHPDLGIGGAERLVIDAAVGLQNRGHKVTVFTSYCDPNHCFDEARDGKRPLLLRRPPARAHA